MLTLNIYIYIYICIYIAVGRTVVGSSFQGRATVRFCSGVIVLKGAVGQKKMHKSLIKGAVQNKASTP